MPRNMSDAEILEILNRIPELPDSANVPIPVAARHDSVSVQTVRRTYPLIQTVRRTYPLTRLSPNRWGINVGYLRQQHRYQPT
jgi:hypothetical protein